MNIKTTALAAFASSCVLLHCAADTTYTGLTDVTDVSTLNGADGNIVLGRGTLKYTGPSCRSGQSLSMASSKVPASTLRRTVRS